MNHSSRPSLFVLLLLGVLTGCTWLQQLGEGTPATSPTPTVIISPTPTPEATPTSAFPSVSRPLTLKLWVPEFMDPYNDTDGGRALTTQLTGFSTENEKIQVEVVAKRDSGPGGLLNLLSSAIGVAPSILPDVIILNNADLKSAASAGLLQPLADISLSWSDFYAFATDNVHTDDGYGIPFIADAEHMVYREGIAETPPISWTAVLTNSYTMIVPAGSPEQLADDAVVAAYIGSGGTVLDQDGHATLDRFYLEQFYGFIFDMLDAGLIDPNLVLTTADAQAAWEIFLGGTGDISPVPMGLYWHDSAREGLPTWMPTAQEKPAIIVRSWSIAMVTTDSQRQQAAQKLVAWLVDPRHMSELARDGSFIPTRRHAVRLWGLLPDDRIILETLLENGTPALPPEVDVPVRQALQFGLRAILTGDVETPQEAATYALTDLRR